MSNQPEYLNLIVQYLNNPQDEELRAAITSFRSKSIDQEKYFLEIERMWNLSSKSSRLELVNTNKSSKRFKEALTNISGNGFNIWQWVGRIAAVMVLASVGFWIYNLNSKVIFVVKSTPSNQTDSIALTDGSLIILSENSTLKYPEKFNTREREIYLTQGKAFFKIAKDLKRPFRVRMGESKVSVLGTSFNLNFSPTTIDLDVKTGRVMFSPYLNGTSSILTAGQALSYNIQKKEFTTRLSQNADSWLTHELVFVDTPLEEVCRQLSGYYKTEIKLESTNKNIKRLNATFKNETLIEVLEVLKEIYSIKIKKQEHKIILKTP